MRWYQGRGEGRGGCHWVGGESLLSGCHLVAPIKRSIEGGNLSSLRETDPAGDDEPEAWRPEASVKPGIADPISLRGIDSSLQVAVHPAVILYRAYRDARKCGILYLFLHKPPPSPFCRCELFDEQLEAMARRYPSAV